MSGRDDISQRLHEAFPLGGDYVTRPELAMIVEAIETKITLSESRQRNWVLGGCLAIIVAYGGGYVSLVSKLDRLNEAMPVVNSVLDGRRSWMLRKDQRDSEQDRALESIAPTYIPQPYVEPPR